MGVRPLLLHIGTVIVESRLMVVVVGEDRERYRLCQGAWKSAREIAVVVNRSCSVALQERDHAAPTRSSRLAWLAQCLKHCLLAAGTHQSLRLRTGPWLVSVLDECCTGCFMVEGWRIP